MSESTDTQDLGIHGTINVKSATKALGAVSKIAAGSKFAVSIVTGVLLTLDGEPSLSATNLDHAMRVKIDGTGTGACVLQIKPLAAALKAFNAERVAVETVSAGAVTLAADGLTLPVPSIGTGADFPILPTGSDDAPMFGIATDVLQSCVRRVAPVAAKDDTRPILTGIRIAFDADTSETTFQATDGYRLAEIVTRAAIGEQSMTLLLPAKGVAKAVPFLTGADTWIQQTPKHTQAILTSGPVTYITRMVDGAFPNVEQVKPDEKRIKTRARLNVAATLAAIKTGLMGYKARTLTLDLDPDSDAPVTMTAGKSPDGVYDDMPPVMLEVPAVVTGAPLTVSLNSAYLADALMATGAAEVDMAFTGPNSVARLVPMHEDATTLLMPMHIEKPRARSY